MCIRDSYNNAHNPASLFAGWAQTASALKAFTGDDFWLNRVGEMLEFMRKNGTTPADPGWKYPSVPYASSDPGAVRYRGAADWDDFHDAVPRSPCAFLADQAREMSVGDVGDEHYPVNLAAVEFHQSWSLTAVCRPAFGEPF